MQGLPLRGHYKSGGISDEKGEIDSNFLQLLKVRAEDDEGLKNWLTKSQCKYTSQMCRMKFFVISRNGPYIGGHLAFYFKLNFKQVYNVL